MAEQIYDDKILEAVDESPKVEDNTIELSSGVILRQKPVNILRIQALVNRFKYPPVPEFYDEKKDRMVRNPNSPEYLEMRQQIDIERTLAVIDITIASGTETVFAPEHLPKVEEDEWLKELVETKVILEIPESFGGKYLAWVKYVAIVTAEDMQKVSMAAGLGMGASERRVATALETSFQDN